MFITKADIKIMIIDSVGEEWSDEDFFYNFFTDLMISLQKLEQKSIELDDKTFPLIFRHSYAQKSVTINHSAELKIAKYVAENLKEYIIKANVNVDVIDKLKVIYWVGMYIYERYNHVCGISFLQAEISGDIYNDTGKRINGDMCTKMENFAEKGKEEFFHYYGRFGLYHSLKQIQKTLYDYL